MRPSRLMCALAPVVLLGCAADLPARDAGPSSDAGAVDAGSPDAGRPPRDAGTPDAGFTRAEASGWCAAQAQALCARDVRCGRVAAVRVGDCEARRAAACDQPATTRAVAEGRLQFLASEAVACLNAFAEGSCTDEPAACASAFTGLVPPDGGCILPSECAPGAFCFQYDDQCPHRCQPYLPRGAPCNGFSTQCAPATDTCTTGDAGERVCLPFAPEGAACTSWDDCAPTHGCVNDTCVKRTAALGEPCGQVSGFPYCTGELFCRQSAPVNGVRPPGTCQQRAGLGGTCTGSGACLPSLRCSTVITTGTCLPKAGPGENCVNYDDCEDGLYCDGRAQQCRPLPGPGGDCSPRGSFYRCAPGASCEFSGTGDDTCAALRPVGAACSSSGLCASGECDFGPLPDGGYGGACIAACSARADGGF